MNFSEIVKAFDEVSQISSTNEKIAWLQAHDDEEFKAILKWYLDPSVITGIAEKKYDKVEAESNAGGFVTQDVKTFADVMRFIEFNHTGKDSDVAYIKWLESQIALTPEEKATFRALVCKNFPMGLQEGIVNKAFPGLVPTFDVMLANNITKLNDSQLNKVTHKNVDYYELTLEDGTVILSETPYTVGDLYSI